MVSTGSQTAQCERPHVQGMRAIEETSVTVAPAGGRDS